MITTIVFVNPVGVIGGAERALLTILAALRSLDPNLRLYLIVATSGPLVESAKALGVQVKILKLPDQVNQLGDSAFQGNGRGGKVLMLLLRVVTALPAVMQYRVKLQQTIREINPDLIHSNGIKTHLLTASVSKHFPVVWHIHDFYGSRPLVARILRWMSGQITGGIAVSEAVARNARATLPHLPVAIVHNAIDVNHFSPGTANSSRMDSLASRLIPADVTRIGLVATFARWKGHDVFLDAAAQVIRQRPDLNVHFYIVGSPIYRTNDSQFSEQELWDRALALQIEHKVALIGFQQNVADVYRQLDIVVHASTQPEPFGLAIVEAMACGKPVIVSQAGGAAELFTHNYDAVGVQPGEPTALASAIQYLIQNPDHRKRLSENARETVLKRFSHDRLGQQILTAYKRFNIL
jgi:glycosyltransferase involved in cell wall biosynthesis